MKKVVPFINRRKKQSQLVAGESLNPGTPYGPSSLTGGYHEHRASNKP